MGIEYLVRKSRQIDSSGIKDWEYNLFIRVDGGFGIVCVTESSKSDIAYRLANMDYSQGTFPSKVSPSKGHIDDNILISDTDIVVMQAVSASDDDVAEIIRDYFQVYENLKQAENQEAAV